MVSKMMGCRVPDKLDEVIRKRADKENRSVNDIMVELLKNGFNDFPEKPKKEKVNNVNMTDTVVIIQKVKKLKSEIKDLEESDKVGILGSHDQDIQACIDALKIQVRQLISTLDLENKNKELTAEEDDDEFWNE